MPKPARSPEREDILSRMKKHMAAHGLQDLVVPEWGCTLYWSPITLAEREEIRQRAASHGLDDAQAHAIFLKAVDRDGKKVFDLGDKLVLLHQADAGVVSRVATAMTSDRPSLAARVEESEKNSEATNADT